MTSFCAAVDRDLVVVRGPDATSFLQRLVSQDLDPVAVGGTAHTLLLQPQGKLLVEFYAHRLHDDEWWCVCEGGFGSVLAEGLARFKIRVKLEIEPRPVAALAVRGRDLPAEAFGAVCVPVVWADVAAFDAVGEPAQLDALRDVLAVPLVDAAGYERARIEAGVPKLGADVDDRTIPQEAGLERDAVSFTKGCFVGQELVCRIDSRGHVNRLLRRLRARGEVAVGTDVVAGADGKVVGAVTSTAGDVALAMVRREIEPGTSVDVGGMPAVVSALVSDVAE